MIRSMTGFGRTRFEARDTAFEVEIRSVNHRHLDVRAKLPRPFAEFEAQCKALVQRRLLRGKVDVSVSFASGGTAGTDLEIDYEVAGRYVEASRAIAERFAVSGELGLGEVLALPGVARFVEQSLEPELFEQALSAAVDRAVDALVAMREREGKALADEFAGRLATVEELVARFEARAGTVVEAVRERLRKRSEQLREETGLFDEARLHQEIVIAADRLDITEELVRLRSHVGQFRAILAEGGEEPVGRRLDFLLQEMGREANTVGSKASDAPLAHDVVELKSELERIREQVQNVE